MGDDMGDADEVKVFQHDEECEEEKKLIAEERQSDSLTEDKSSLITEGESQVRHFFLSQLDNPPDPIFKKKKNFSFSQNKFFIPPFFFVVVFVVVVGLAPLLNTRRGVLGKKKS